MNNIPFNKKLLPIPSPPDYYGGDSINMTSCSSKDFEPFYISKSKIQMLDNSDYKGGAENRTFIIIAVAIFVICIITLIILFAIGVFDDLLGTSTSETNTLVATPTNQNTPKASGSAAAPIDGRYTDYVISEDCVKSKTDNSLITCGSGVKKKTREYIKATNKGKDIPNALDNLINWDPCSMPDKCPIDGYYTQYVNEGSCLDSKGKAITCGPGMQKQTCRYVPSENGGSDDKFGSQPLTRTVPCNLPDCVVKNGSYTEYKDNGVCVKSKTDNKAIKCGSGVQKQIRQYLNAENGGTEIAAKDRVLENWETCALEDCLPTMDGSCSQWVDDGECYCDPKDNKYKISQVREYFPPEGEGIESTCKNILSRTILCATNPLIADSYIPPGSTYNAACPTSAKYIPYPIKDESKCKPAKGDDRTQTIQATYTFPIGNDHDRYISSAFTVDELNIIKNLTNGKSATIKDKNDQIDTIITRINSGMPEQYKLIKTIKCDFVPYFSEEEINGHWVDETRCTNPVSDLVTELSTTMTDLMKLSKVEDVKGKFRRFTIPSLMENYDIDDINKCYKSGTYMKIDRSYQYDSNNKLLPKIIIPKILKSNISYHNNKGDVSVLKNNIFDLIFKVDGKLYLFQNDTTELWNSGNNTKGIELRVLGNGNLALYGTNNTIVWQSNTADNNNAYLCLTSTGHLFIRTDNNKSHEFIKYIAGKGEYPSSISRIIDNNTELNKPLIYDSTNFDVVILKHNNYLLILQYDGNLVLYDRNGNARWNTGTRDAKTFMINEQGNMILSDSAGKTVWNTNTGKPGARLYLTSNGYLFLRDPNNKGIENYETIYPKEYPNFIQKNSYFSNSEFGVVVLQYGNNLLVLQYDGNLVLYNNSVGVWSQKNIGMGDNKVSALHVQDDNNIVIFGSDGKHYYSNSYGIDGIGLHLKNNGFLIIRKKYSEEAEAYRVLYPSEEYFNQEYIDKPILDYLRSTFYDNSDWTMFTNREGLVWACTKDWTSLNRDSSKEPRFSDLFSCSIDTRHNFNECLTLPNDDGGWNVDQVSLLGTSGYNQKYDDTKPVDNDEYNYSSEANLKEWGALAGNNNSNIKNGAGILPAQFGGDYKNYLKPGQSSGKNSNYIPGYETYSGLRDANNWKTNNRFLVRFKAKAWNVGYIVYIKFTNRDAFAMDIYKNHPTMAINLKNPNAGLVKFNYKTL